MRTKHYKKYRVCALLAGLWLCALSTVAQNTGTGVGNEEVIVVKEYEATIQDAQKVTLQPDIPETEEKAPVFEYNVPAREWKEFSFEANPLKPVAMSKEKLERHNTSFIKLGFGSQLTPLVQLAYNDDKAKNIRFGVYYNHLSMYGFNIRNQRFSDDEAAAYVRFYPKKVEIGTRFNFHNYRTHFYGLTTDTLLQDSTIKAKDVRQVFRRYDAELTLRNTTANRAGINVGQTLRFNYLQETFGKANEWFVYGLTRVEKRFGKVHGVQVDFTFDVSRLKNDSLVLQRNIFTLLPGYTFDNDDWEARGFIGLAVDGKKVFPIADAHLEKRLFQHSVIAFVSYRLDYRKNSLNTLAQQNHFIYNFTAIQNSHAGSFAAGLKGALNRFSYDASFQLQHINRLPLFVNDTADLRRFYVLYSTKALVYGAHAGAGYNVKEWLRLLASADYYHYQLRDQPRAWHQPALRVSFTAQYVWKNKIKARVELYGLTATYARLAGGSQARIKGLADINLQVEYIMNRHFSFFGYLNNIAHMRYQRWYGYPSFGVNGVAGAKFSF